jgi:hypothetical protein
MEAAIVVGALSFQHFSFTFSHTPLFPLCEPRFRSLMRATPESNF